MGKTLTDDEIRAQYAAAVERGTHAAATEPHAAAVRYDDVTHAVVVELTNGATFTVPVDLVPSLRDATEAERADVRVGPAGVALTWPALDEDLSVAGLVREVFGARVVAQAQGAAGGRARSPEKAAAARENGAKGGRPRRTTSDVAGPALAGKSGGYQLVGPRGGKVHETTAVRGKPLASTPEKATIRDKTGRSDKTALHSSNPGRGKNQPAGPYGRRKG